MSHPPGIVVDLPPPAELAALLKRHALLNAVLCPSPPRRFHRFEIHREWSAGRIRRDDASLTAVFAAAAAVVEIIDPRAPSSPAPFTGAALPASLAAHLDLARPHPGPATVHLWWSGERAAWAASRPPMVGAGLLRLIFADPCEFADWARHTFRLPVAPSAVARVYAGQALTADLVRSLNPACPFAALFAECRPLHPVWDPG